MYEKHGGREIVYGGGTCPDCGEHLGSALWSWQNHHCLNKPIKLKIMSTRAKFTCNEITKRKGWVGTPEFIYAAKFSAVTSGSEENKSFFAATPSGSIEIGTVKEDHFEVGKSYFVDFTPAD